MNYTLNILSSVSYTLKLKKITLYIYIAQIHYKNICTLFLSILNEANIASVIYVGSKPVEVLPVSLASGMAQDR